VPLVVRDFVACVIKLHHYPKIWCPIVPVASALIQQNKILGIKTSLASYHLRTLQTTER
jgi:hypothetical protein